jgi:putative FmdB family regulatory protein
LPLYDYQCRACQKVTEVRHGFKEPYTGACPECGATNLARIFNPAPILFKGSGFYVTDSRKSSGSGDPASKSDAPAKTDAAPKGDAPKADAPKADAPKGEAAPAKTESAA